MIDGQIHVWVNESPIPQSHPRRYKITPKSYEFIIMFPPTKTSFGGFPISPAKSGSTSVSDFVDHHIQFAGVDVPHEFTQIKHSK